MERLEHILPDFSQSGSFIAPTVEKEERIQKRRSFASRKSLCFDKIGGDCNPLEDRNKDDVGLEEKEKEYAENLETERDGWKKLYETRKKQLKLSRKAYSQPPLLDWRSCEDILSDEDKQFLKNKPDYDKIISKLEQCEELAGIYAHMRLKTANINNSILAVINKQLAEKKKNVFKYLDSHCNLD